MISKEFLIDVIERYINLTRQQARTFIVQVKREYTAITATSVVECWKIFQGNCESLLDLLDSSYTSLSFSNEDEIFSFIEKELHYTLSPVVSVDHNTTIIDVENVHRK